MAKTEAKLNRSTMQRLIRKAEKLEREADDFRTGGLDERAEKLEAEAAQLRERVVASRKAHRREKRERRRRDREAQERHEKAQKELEAEMARRQEARTWYRKWASFRGGFPQPADQAREAAEKAGHNPDDLEAAVVRVRRLKDGTDCFAFKGEYLRGSYRPVERQRDAVGA